MLLDRLADYRTTAVLFAVMVAVLAAMQALFPSTLASPIPDANIRSPVMAFEMARSPSDLDHIFGTVSDPDRARRVTAMDQGNRLDYLFMPAYSLFVLSFLLAAGRELGGEQRGWHFFGALALVAAAADAIENALLLSITSDFDRAPGLLTWLPYPVWIKFGLLAVACGAAAVLLWRLKRPLLALFCIPAPLLLVPGILVPMTLGSLATGLTGVGLIAMGIHAVHRALHPARPI